MTPHEPRAWAPTVLPLLALAGCIQPEMVTGPTESPRILVKSRATVDLGAVLPSDVLFRPDGSLLVLDGYEGKILAVNADGTLRGPWAAEGVGRPVRLSEARDGGVWASIPGLDDEAGLLVHLDATGAVADLIAPAGADNVPLHPVDVVELESGLVMADRTGGLAWLDATTGAVTRTLIADADEQKLRRIVDLSTTDGGGLFAVDSLAPRLFAVSADGVATAPLIRSGLNVGQLARPTSGTPLGNSWLVSDAVLGAVQAFEPDGDLIGVLSDADGLLRFDHPIAVRTAGNAPTIIAVLEARPGRLHLLELAGPLPPAPPPSLIRTPLVDADLDPSGTSGASCFQCHDGLVLDSREVWDPGRKHHPVGIKPERALPEVFKLDAEGKLVCTTCHSPHGVVDASSPDAAVLVRHRSDSSPFTRLEKDADALCIACHAEDEHVNTGTGTLDPKTAGHPTGVALVNALKAREVTGTGPSDPTKASCLSCHAMHGATGEHITRDPGDGTTCLGCHPAVARVESNHPLGHVPGSDLIDNHHDERVQLSSSGGIGCLTCHDLEGTRSKHLLRSLGRSTPVCLDCHTARADLAGSPHSRLGTGGLPTCLACHDIHGGQRNQHFLTAASDAPGDPRGCLSCHGPGKRAAPARDAPGRAGHPVDGSDTKGKGALTCLSCHDAHSADKPDAAACAACHAEQGADAKRGGHGTATCSDCHAAHRDTVFASGKMNPASARCLACHGEGGSASKASKVVAYEHPAPAFLPDGSRWSPLGGMPLFAKDGTPMPNNENGDLTCQSCHMVHGPNAAGDPKLRRGGAWQKACASCHGDDALVLYQYFHQPERRKDVRGATP